MYFEQIKLIHREINDDIFSGVLDTPEITYASDEFDLDYFGAYYPFFGFSVIELSPQYITNFALGFSSLAHEMVHQYQQEFLNAKTWKQHNGTFEWWAQKIEQFYNLKPGDV